MAEDISLHLYSDLNEDEIISFNKEAWHLPDGFLTPYHMQWQFRHGVYEGVEGVYVKYQNEVTGQAGALPVTLKINGKEYCAIWFNNFIVSDTMRGKGLGKLLTQKWMSLAPVHITNCNEKSMAVFKKLGWEEEFRSARYALPLNIAALGKANGWKGAKLAAAKFLNPFYKLYIASKYGAPKGAVVKKITELQLSDIAEHFIKNEDNGIVKDESWVKWRLLDSPYKHEYFRIEYKGAFIYFRIFTYQDTRRMHILYQPLSGTDQQKKEVLKQLISYAIKESVDLIWAITNIVELERVYAPLLTSKLKARFAYHSDVPEVMDAIRKQPIPLQSIDSDYDFMYF